MLEQTEKENLSPHVCPHTISFFLDNWFRKIVQNPKRIVGPYIEPGDTVVDVGCGPGFFSIEMARRVGKSGRVVAVDLQEKMIAHVKRKAARYGLMDRMDFHQCEAHRIGLTLRADFVLAYYMVHETPSPSLFFKEVADMLKAGGRMLVVEPRFHVNKSMFAETVEAGENAGLTVIEVSKNMGGRRVLFGN